MFSSGGFLNLLTIILYGISAKIVLTHSRIGTAQRMGKGGEARMTVFDKLRNCITEPRCRDCEGIPGVCEEDHQSVSIPKALALDVLKELKRLQDEVDELSYQLYG